MNEDFGVRRRRVTNFDVAPRQAQPRIDISKYRSAARIAGNDQPQAIAIAADDAFWNNASIMEPENSNYSFNNSNDDGDGSNSGGNGSNGDGDDSSGQADDGDKKPRRNPFKKLAAILAGLSRKQWLAIGAIVLLLVAGATSYLLTRPDNTVVSSTARKAKKVVPPPKPTSPLTGLEASLEDTKRPVIGVMIENSTFARPQSGLNDAGIVYEAIAEYGITRFLTLFQEANPGNIGPVRSARPYFVDWAHSYDAGYAHVGGSPDALAKIKTDGVRDLDQFANSGAYHRISQREAPHNMYTSMQNLRDLAAAKGYTSSTFTGWTRKKDAPAKTVTANAIDIAISGPTYNVHYDYDAASNTYLRTMGGAPHNDADSGTRLAPKVVIGLITPYSLMADGYHSSYGTTGSGAVKIFQDGTVTEGTWKREGNETYKFTDANGKPIALDAGQTWVTAVGDPAAVTYSAPAPPAPTPAPAATPKPKP
jgi:hypothetical protein